MMTKDNAKVNIDMLDSVLSVLKGAIQHINPYQDSTGFQRDLAYVLQFCISEFVPVPPRRTIGFTEGTK